MSCILRGDNIICFALCTIPGAMNSFFERLLLEQFTCDWLATEFPALLQTARAQVKIRAQDDPGETIYQVGNFLIRFKFLF